MIALAKALDIPFAERRFTVGDAKNAAEAFATSASTYIQPVTRIDGSAIGNGKAGRITMALIERYLSYMTEETRCQS